MRSASASPFSSKSSCIQHFSPITPSYLLIYLSLWPPSSPSPPHGRHHSLHSFNAQIAGTADGARTYYLTPMFWNKDIRAGYRRILIQGLTTPDSVDNTPLTASGHLWYDGDAQYAISAAPNYTPQPRPIKAPPATAGERYNLAEVLQVMYVCRYI